MIGVLRPDVVGVGVAVGPPVGAAVGAVFTYSAVNGNVIRSAVKRIVGVRYCHGERSASRDQDHKVTLVKAKDSCGHGLYRCELRPA